MASCFSTGRVSDSALKASFILVCFLLTGCVRLAPLPVLGHVPDFTLTSQSGESFDGKSLDGKIWAADFIYTHYPGPGPRMSSQMRRFQTPVTPIPDAPLVSIAAYPESDRPPLLTEY